MQRLWDSYGPKWEADGYHQWEDEATSEVSDVQEMGVREKWLK